MAKKAKKKAGTKRSAVQAQRLFSLVALHHAFQKAQDRLMAMPATPACRQLMQDMKNSRAIISCGQTMSPDIG